MSQERRSASSKSKKHKKSEDVARTTRANSVVGENESPAMPAGPPGASASGVAGATADLTTILSKLDSMESKFSSRFGNLTSQVKDLQNDLTAAMNNNIKMLKDEMHIELGRLHADIGNLTIRLVAVESKVECKDFDPNKTIMLYNIAQNQHETENEVLNTVNNLISQGLEMPGIEVVRIKRCAGSPGPIKVEVPSEKLKIELLRAKQKLKNKPQFKQIYVRSAKSHECRLLEQNMKTLLAELNLTRNFRFTGSGRLVRAQERNGDDASGGADGRDQRGRGAISDQRQTSRPDNRATPPGGQARMSGDSNTHHTPPGGQHDEDSS